MLNTNKGTVKFFNKQKGYGFITPDNGGNDVFVHITALQSSGIDTLNEGDKVTYGMESNRGKTCACDISRAA